MGTWHSFMKAKRLSMVLIILSILGLSFLTGCASKESIQQPPPSTYKKVQTISLPEHSVSHDVFVFSDDDTFSKPPVLLLHELPGLSEPTIKYAESLQDQFTVYVPLLFGDYGQQSKRKGWHAYIFNGEWWKLYKPAGSRKITQWLREALQDISEQHPQQNIGIIGMCLTGGMPLALVENEKVHAVVIAQPSLPLWRWFPKKKASLDISDDEWETAKQQFKERPVYAYGVRFEKDSVARREKHERMIEELNCETCKGGFIDAEIRESEYEEANIPEDAHSTLMFHLGENDQSHPAEKRRREIKQFLQDPASFYSQHTPASD